MMPDYLQEISNAEMGTLFIMSDVFYKDIPGCIVETQFVVINAKKSGHISKFSNFQIIGNYGFIPILKFSNVVKDCNWPGQNCQTWFRGMDRIDSSQIS